MLQPSKWSKQKSRQDPHHSQISDNGHLYHLEVDNQRPSHLQIQNGPKKPTHQTHSLIINEIPLHAFYRKQTSITKPRDSNYLGTKGQAKNQSPLPWHGRSFTDVSSYMHKPPFPQLPQDVPLLDYKKNLGEIDERQYFPSKQRPTQQSCESIFKHWWQDEPKRHLQITVPPQYMKEKDLYAVLPRHQIST
jgi:hypothetical protein